MQPELPCGVNIDLSRWATLVLAATQDVFASMIFLDLKPGNPVEGKDASFDSSLSSMIGLAGDLKGLLAVHCTRETALSITSSMLGMEVDELDEDVKDAIGEVANMVAGGIKASLTDYKVNIELAIPSVAVGKGIRVSSISKGCRVLLPFTIPAGTFGIEFQYVCT
ncbi:MAG: chemotaxis protein CheX [Desulfobulbus propionicus]|nr:MAG: chemotaxis protein CheX [Desulfobulbus propionicus]